MLVRHQRDRDSLRAEMREHLERERYTTHDTQSYTTHPLRAGAAGCEVRGLLER